LMMDDKEIKIIEMLPLRKRLMNKSYLCYKFKRKGLSGLTIWIFSNLKIFIARLLYPVLTVISAFFFRTFRRKGKLSDKTLYAFYDLETSPETYDFFTFLALADMRRSGLGCENIHVLIVPGNDSGFKEGFFKYYDLKNKIWRLRNILIPGSWLLKSCTAVTACADRREAGTYFSIAKNIFPGTYSVALPVGETEWRYLLAQLKDGSPLPEFAASAQALEYVKSWINVHANGKKVISITLRESKYSPDRNSNLKAWCEFARSLSEEYLPVLIRDTERAFETVPEDMEGLQVFNEAAWHLDLRAAFYMQSYLNLAINNGPTSLSYLLKDSRVLEFKLTTPTVMATTEEYIMKTVGIGPGDNPILDDRVRLIWEDDNLDIIQREFEKMIEDMNSKDASFNR